MAALVDDEEAQKKGFISISYQLGNQCTTTSRPTATTTTTISTSSSCSSSISKRFLDVSRKLPILMEAIPMRHGCMHFCYENPNLRPLALFIQHGINMESRLRFRAHYGT